MKTRGFIFFFLTALSIIMVNVDGHNVLFMPANIGSRIMMHASVAEALVKNGHRASILKHRSVPIPSQFRKSGIDFVDFETDEKAHFFMSKNFTDITGRMQKGEFLAVIPQIPQILNKQCSDILMNEALYAKLKEAKYDFVILENLLSFHCWFAVPHRLNVPYGGLMVVPPFDLFSVTLQTNFIIPTLPFYYASGPSFVQRLFQFAMINVLNTMVSFTDDMEAIHHYTRDRPVQSMRELEQNAKLWFVDMHPLVDVPKHTAPNVIYLGGLTAGPPKALPERMAKFADSAKRGLIVVSFGGSFTAEFPQAQIDKLLRALNAVEFKVIMRLKMKPSFTLRDGIMLVDWLPQNDLLGHPNTRLFITHCGASSLSEAVYHGVPMLGIPNQKEQLYNARQFTDRGYGDFLDRELFTVDDLLSMIKTLTENPKYRDTMRRMSAITKSSPFTPAEKAAYWIDHVIKFGADHLTPFTANLYWYEILMLDIMAFLLAIVVVTLYVLKTCVSCFCRRCCRSRKPAKKEKTS